MSCTFPKVRDAQGNESDDLNSIQFVFSDIVRPDATEITFTMTNFINPWSAITVSSISINSYANADCSGSADSSKSLSPLDFFPLFAPADTFSVTSTVNTLGYSAADNAVIFKMTPYFSASKDGAGQI